MIIKYRTRLIDLSRIKASKIVEISSIRSFFIYINRYYDIMIMIK